MVKLSKDINYRRQIKHHIKKRLSSDDIVRQIYRHLIHLSLREKLEYMIPYELIAQPNPGATLAELIELDIFNLNFLEFIMSNYNLHYQDYLMLAIDENHTRYVVNIAKFAAKYSLISPAKLFEMFCYYAFQTFGISNLKSGIPSFLSIFEEKDIDVVQFFQDAVDYSRPIAIQRYLEELGIETQDETEIVNIINHNAKILDIFLRYVKLDKRTLREISSFMGQQGNYIFKNVIDKRAD